MNWNERVKNKKFSFLVFLIASPYKTGFEDKLIDLDSNINQTD